MEDDKMYADLCGDPSKVIKVGFENRIIEATKSGLSSNIFKTLQKLTERYQSLFKGRLRNTPPAKVLPIKNNLKSSKASMKAKLRRFSNAQ